MTFVIHDKVSNKAVSKAAVRLSDILKLSDTSGMANFDLKGGKYNFSILHHDHKPFLLTLQVDSSIIYPVFLEANSTSIAEVTINNQQKGSSPAAMELSAKDLEKVPAFMGQKDPVKLMQTLPGTGKGGDGNSGMFIRGGSSGQNLTLLNHAVVYNPSHLLGFFSVFNGEAIDKIKLYKSGIPSEYGGRLSSVIEVSTRARLTDSLSFSGGISLLGADLNIALPLGKKLALNTSLRKTYMGITIWPALSKLQNENSSFNDLAYDFFDGNLNAIYQLDKNNIFSYSAFASGDDFGFGINRFDVHNGMDWKNQTHSLIWKSFIKSNVFISTILTNSNYQFNFGMEQDKYQAKITSAIKDYTAKSFITAITGKHQFKGGLEYIRHNYKPNTPYVKNVESVYDFGQPNIYHSDESAVFVSDDVKLSDKTSVYVGARFTRYRHLGPYSFANDLNMELSYNKGEAVSNRIYVEPSLGFQYAWKANTAFRFSFSRNVQPVHLISVTAVNFPADFWMPSLGKLKPQKAFQGSGGIFYNNPTNQYEAYADFYYKSMDGLSEFSGGIMNLIDNLKIEENLFYGKGKAYGAEFFLEKKSGRLTGWISYTLAQNNRQFPLINNGKTFPAKYDRRHDLSIVSAWHLNKKWQFNSTFTFATGNTYTKPVSRYMISGSIVNEYGPYNGTRMPAYHRLDLAATCLLKSKSRFKNELQFSVYNVYSRLNPVYIYFMAEGDLDKYRVSITPKSVSVLPVLPSVSYRFLFK